MHTLTPLIPARLRRIEPALRAGWLRLALKLFGGEGGPLPDWSDRPYNLLFIRYDKLGDMIMCSGVLREIVRAHPAISVDVLTTPANAPALENLSFVRDVIVHERGRRPGLLPIVRRLEQNRYDVAIDGLVWRPSVSSYTTKLMLASRARWRVGSAGRRNDFVYNVPVSPPPTRWAEHHVHHLARLAVPFGLEVSDGDWRPEIALTSAECVAAEWRWDAVPGSGPRVLVNLSAGHPERRWSDQKFTQLVAHVRRRMPNAGIAIVALPGERTSADRLAAQVHGSAMTPGLRELFALVASADVIVTPDTAVSHIASAFQRTTLTLLRRRAEYHIWVPYRTPGRNVFGDDEATLEGLPIERAIAALDDLLDEWLALHGATGPSSRRRRPLPLETLARR
ncbi:MAG TPA: glycosyltransferase family 9 protein [Gemmatimonadaceae bacterium]|nr:glycosyltransferase family 9 protein [Gemmatimonadaceae bacterium]